MDVFKKIRELIGLDLPPVQSYGIDKRPRRNINVQGNRTTTTKVNNGKPQTDHVDDEGRIVTTIGHKKPETPNQVTIDRFDDACLDFVVGVKWRKDEQKAAILKWHWMNNRSAEQIESWHTDKQTRQLERGFSERTVATFITAFYDADDEREKSGAKRLRPPRGDQSNGDNVVEW